MGKIASILTSFVLLFAAPAFAQDRTVFVELFTSQGCSSCPPADAFMHKLAERDDVVALALHVDYWDYIGWKDSFATPEFTARQRAYAREANRRMVYTPQMVINGSDHVVGNRPMDANDLIKQHSALAQTVELAATRQGDDLIVQAMAVERGAGDFTVQLFRYRPNATVAISRGENAGRTIDYVNIVTEMSIIATWNGLDALDITVPISGDLPAVVLVQQQKNGPVQAVSRVQ